MDARQKATLEAIGELMGELRQEFHGKLANLPTDPNALFKSIFVASASSQLQSLRLRASDIQHRTAKILTGSPPKGIKKSFGMTDA
jgi:hypothetical protein